MNERIESGTPSVRCFTQGQRQTGRLAADHLTWIAQHVPTAHEAAGNCAAISLEMQTAFPDLVRVRGHYQDLVENACYPHWWLVTATGQIVDPTVHQFPDCGLGEYTPWDESALQPTGKCYNCGEYAYYGDGFCSQACRAEYMAMLNRHRDPG